jgi:hypothetical protein
MGGNLTSRFNHRVQTAVYDVSIAIARVITALTLANHPL